MFWTGLTNFGDAAAMLPAAAAITLWLVVGRAWRAGFVWIAVVGLTSALVAVSKIAFIGWGLGIEALDFTGFSGHSALATMMLGVGAYLSFQPMSRPIRLAALVAGFAGGIAVGISRVVLEFHSPSEVVAGCLVGLGAGCVFVRFARPAFRPPALPVGLGASLCLLLLVIHGQRAPTQQWIIQIALFMSGHSEPYQRWPDHVRQRDGTWRTAEVVGVGDNGEAQRRYRAG
jgi:hypothetical protein